MKDGLKTNMYKVVTAYHYYPIRVQDKFELLTMVHRKLNAP